MALFAWKTIQVAAITSGGSPGAGDQEVTIPGIGTPLAVIIEVTRALTAGTGADHAVVSVGAADDTNQFNLGNRDRDNFSGSDAGKRGGSDGCIIVVNATANTIDGRATRASFITDGVRLNWSDFPAGAYLLNVTFIYGTVGQVKVRNLVTAGVLNQIDEFSGLGFDPNLALFWWYRIDAGQSPSGASNDSYFHHGMAVDAGDQPGAGPTEQACYSQASRDNRLTSGWGMGARDDCVLQDVTQSSTGSATYGTRLELNSWQTGTGGIKLKTVNGTQVFNMIAVLASTGKNRRTVKLVDLDTGTTGTGTNKKVTTGWKPKLVRTLGTTLSI